MKHQFTAEWISRGPKGAWTKMLIPAAVTKALGTTARVPVKGTLNGFAFRTSIMPEGDGTHSMAINKTMQEGAKAHAGDKVRVVLERDTQERVVELPPQLKKALAGDAKAQATFEALAYSHRKEYADWIAGAKQAETRERRIEKALAKLREGKKTK